MLCSMERRPSGVEFQWYFVSITMQMQPLKLTMQKYILNFSLDIIMHNIIINIRFYFFQCLTLMLMLFLVHLYIVVKQNWCTLRVELAKKVKLESPNYLTANFGPWDLGPQHGFARICHWEVAKEPKVRNSPFGTYCLKFVRIESINWFWKQLNTSRRKMGKQQLFSSWKHLRLQRCGISG